MRYMYVTLFPNASLHHNFESRQGSHALKEQSDRSNTSVACFYYSRRNRLKITCTYTSSSPVNNNPPRK